MNYFSFILTNPSFYDDGYEIVNLISLKLMFSFFNLPFPDLLNKL